MPLYLRVRLTEEEQNELISLKNEQALAKRTRQRIEIILLSVRRQLLRPERQLQT
jgi:hypothetical protein